MCGFTFQHAPDLSRDDLTARGRAALVRMRHRGPDEEGLEVQAPWSLGNRRLSIIDLATSRQPMADPTGRWWLSFNGEIYNFAEVRPSLEARWSFRTRGDTEVLLAGLALDGPGFLDRLEGMWGFALWDAGEGRLLLGRDRMGQKPVYYRTDGPATLAAASELPTLAQLVPGPWEEDPDATADYFRYGYQLPGTTAYRGVREVPPACVATWRPGGPVREERYWSPAVGGFRGSRAEAREALDGALVAAVRRRLVADVEVGAFLSGGIDSSLVVGLCAERLGVKLRTFTIGFGDATYDERRFAQRAAEHWGLTRHEEVLESWDRRRLTELVLGHVGQPFSDSSLLPTAAVSCLAAGHVKVALSGDGGDELFGGYQRYLGRRSLRLWGRVPRPLRRSAEAVLRGLLESTSRHRGGRLGGVHRIVDVAERGGEQVPYVAPLVFSRRQLAALVPDLAGRGAPPPELPTGARRDPVGEMMVGDLHVYLPQDILVKVDRASMACSLEARSPFLDRRVVELALSLPRSFHRRGLVGKRMLRETFSDLLPAELWRRRKQGFAVPVHDWFRDGLDRELEELLGADPGAVAPAAVGDLLSAHRAGRGDHGSRLWIVFVYLLWRAHGASPGFESPADPAPERS